MKRLVVITWVGIALFLTAFKLSVEKDIAIVDQKEGLYIFMLCKPKSEYKYLGSVKKAISWTGQPGEMLNSMIKKVKNNYPEANGIIFTSVDMDRVDAIHFEDK